VTFLVLLGFLPKLMMKNPTGIEGTKKKKAIPLGPPVSPLKPYGPGATIKIIAGAIITAMPIILVINLNLWLVSLLLMLMDSFLFICRSDLVNKYDVKSLGF